MSADGDVECPADRDGDGVIELRADDDQLSIGTVVGIANEVRAFLLDLERSDVSATGGADEAQSALIEHQCRKSRVDSEIGTKMDRRTALANMGA